MQPAAPQPPTLAPLAPAPGVSGPRWAVLGGLALAAVGALGLSQGLEPFRTYFYAFVWWGWILVASGWTQRRTGRSLLFTRPRAFAVLTLWSVTFWLLFECLNVVLDNWYYVGAMPTLSGRLFGMAVCFATVLPGVFATRDWLASLGLFAAARSRPRPLSKHLARNLALVGVAMTVLPMVQPKYFYPLVWGSTFFLGEAYLVHRGRRSIVTILFGGDPRPALQLLAAGFVTGGLWESWNFHAGAKWIYTVPFFEEVKLFEMPVLGFLGFPPFALECYSFACLLVALGWCPPFDEGFDREDQSRATPGRIGAGALAAILLAPPMMVLTDVEVVRATRALVAEVPGLPAAARDGLEAEGYTDVRDLLRALDGGAPPATWRALEGPVAARARDQLELMNTALMGARGLAWLDAAGVDTVAELAALEWQAVIELAASPSPEAADLRATHGPVPYDREARYWIRAARRSLESVD